MTLQEVNPAVHLLLPGAAFTRLGKGSLYLVCNGKQYRKQYRWRLRSDRLWPYDRRSCTFTAGTIVQALTQLSLWLRDYPRLGIGWWRYITGPKVWPESQMERGQKLVEYLAKSSYVDAAKHVCVMCGSHQTWDWFANEKGTVVGPYCGVCYR